MAIDIIVENNKVFITTIENKVEEYYDYTDEVVKKIKEGNPIYKEDNNRIRSKANDVESEISILYDQYKSTRKAINGLIIAIGAIVYTIFFKFLLSINIEKLKNIFKW
jgi:hypothetical protein